MMIQELLQIRKSGLQIPIPFFPNSSFAYFEKINDAGLKNDSTEGRLNRPKRMPWWKQKKHGRVQVLKVEKSPGMAKTFRFKLVLGNPLLAIRSLPICQSYFSEILINLWRRGFKNESL